MMLSLFLDGILCYHGSEDRGQARGRFNERKRCLLKQNRMLQVVQYLKRVSQALCNQRSKRIRYS